MGFAVPLGQALQLALLLLPLAAEYLPEVHPLQTVDEAAPGSEQKPPR